MTWPIGKTYDGGAFEVTAEGAAAYADATDDPNPAYRTGGVAPPMFHVRPFIPLMMEMARDPELSIDMLRLVHGEHGMRFLGPLQTGTTLQLSGSLLDVAEKSSGTVYTFALRGAVDGTPVLDGSTSYFVRASRPPEGGAKKPKAAREEPPPPSWSVEQPVAADQAVRYADASGDHNPIHVDPEVARKAGLPGCILHGLCTLAFAQRDLVQHAGEGDPSRLVALSARFTGMVLPGDTLRMDVWGEGDEVRFSTMDSKGRTVLTGRAEMR